MATITGTFDVHNVVRVSLGPIDSNTTLVSGLYFYRQLRIDYEDGTELRIDLYAKDDNDPEKARAGVEVVL